jgi:hypothetical protein
VVLGDLKQKGQGEFEEVLLDRIIETRRRWGNRKYVNWDWVEVRGAL